MRICWPRAVFYAELSRTQFKRQDAGRTQAIREGLSPTV